jgi:hypothetical protein
LTYDYNSGFYQYVSASSSRRLWGGWGGFSGFVSHITQTVVHVVQPVVHVVTHSSTQIVKAGAHAAQ